MKPNIHFIPVKDNNVKMRTLCATLLHHYRKGDTTLVTVGSEEVARYVDELLWRYPKESFLPHQLAQKPTKSKICITTRQENLNQATVLFNLCPMASAICQHFPLVYEFYDETHPDKQKLSEERLKQYKAQNLIP